MKVKRIIGGLMVFAVLASPFIMYRAGTIDEVLFHSILMFFGVGLHIYCF